MSNLNYDLSWMIIIFKDQQKDKQDNNIQIWQAEKGGGGVVGHVVVIMVIW